MPDMREHPWPGCVWSIARWSSLANARLTEACVARVCQQVRDDLRRDGDIEVNVHELRDHRAALDSRDVFAVLENFFRLLLVRSNFACLVCWTIPVGMMTRVE